MKQVFLLAGCLSIVLFSCTSDESKTAESADVSATSDSIANLNELSFFEKNDSLFKKLEKPFDRFIIKSDKGDNIKLANGSSLSIPSACFVDSANNKISGDVVIEYREIKTAAEIILSGITMVYDSASHQYDFQTAGMFEFRAYQDGKALKFAKDKKVQVSMATDKKDNNYNFYRLNDDGANWTYLSSSHNEHSILPASFMQSAGIKNTEVAAAQQEFMEEPIAPNKLDESRPVWDLSFDLNEHPELLGLAGLMWQYAGDDASKDPSANKNLLKTKWNKVSIRPMANRKGAFYVDLSFGSVKMSTEARPVLQGKPYEKAYEDYTKNLKKYKEFLVKKEKESHAPVAVVQNTNPKTKTTTLTTQPLRTVSNTTTNAVAATLAQPAEYVITNNIVDVGIYNCDRLNRMQDPIQLIADFDVPKATNNSVVVYLVTGEQDVIVAYRMVNWKDFVYSEVDKNRLVALMSDGRVATFSTKEFKAIDTKKFNKREKNDYLFKMTMSEKPIESADELDKIISQL